jgi:hypothetical protein
MNKPKPKFTAGDRVMILKGPLTGRTVIVDKVGICPIFGIPDIRFGIDWGRPSGLMGYALPETWARLVTDE